MARRLALLSALLIVLGVPAGTAAGAGADEWQRKQNEIQDRIDALRHTIERASSRATVLTSEISLVTSKIRTLEREVARATGRLHRIEVDLAIRRNRLAALTLTYRLQTDELNRLKREYTSAELRANRRLVAIYEEEDPSAVDVVLTARSFTDMLDHLDFLREIGRQDRSIATQLATAKHRMATARRKTNEARTQIAKAAQALQARLDEQLAERNRLVAAETQLADIRATKRQTLSIVQASKGEFLHEVAGLEQASRDLAVKIRSAQSTSTVSVGGPSASGLVWPVSGPVTSPFGWRWGRMHEGIDIGAPTGTTIVAAGAGVVIYSGWMSGYGNLVVIDHGGGLATAYGHMSSIAAGSGASVERGQVIGYVGCTGHCFGPHLHFEVRVNGQAVDPLGYL
jgi:murein DD-endopeptidase MepM/ murein hydrolase activator NlpD